MSNWTTEAACANVTNYVAEMFFIPEIEPFVIEVFCKDCPVKELCLQEALEYETHLKYIHGVFGGLLPRERARMLRERKAKEKQNDCDSD